MHDSFMPLSGLVLLANMMLDEVIVGGPGSGLFGMLLFAIVAVFVAGLMIGRTPEYLGKKIEANEIKMTMLALLRVPAFILVPDRGRGGAAGGPGRAGQRRPARLFRVAVCLHLGRGTNGSAFAGLTANTPFYNLTLALAMFAGRFLVIVPVLCIAGGLAAKRIVPASAGTLPTHGPQFVGLLVGTVVIVGGLTFFPALALGPVAEQFAMQAGTDLLYSLRGWPGAALACATDCREDCQGDRRSNEEAGTARARSGSSSSWVTIAAMSEVSQGNPQD